MLNAFVNALNNFKQDRKKQKEISDKALASGPSWRHRRRLIYGAYVVAILMIAYGSLNIVIAMSEAGVQLIIGGVALLSIILTAYTAVATYEDVRIWKRSGPAEDLDDPSDLFDTDNPDGI